MNVKLYQCPFMLASLGAWKCDIWCCCSSAGDVTVCQASRSLHSEGTTIVQNYTNYLPNITAPHPTKNFNLPQPQISPSVRLHASKCTLVMSSDMQSWAAQYKCTTQFGKTCYVFPPHLEHNAVGYPKLSVLIYHTTWRHITEGRSLHENKTLHQ
jgi:hypothetical protein